MLKKSLTTILTLSFTLTSILGSNAQASVALNLPEPGKMVSLSKAFQPAMIKGVTINKDNPFLFDFIVDPGQNKLSDEALKAEGEKQIRYFMAALTVPAKDLWVNLSPYEKNRTINDALGQTDMGRDLLAQDYILKQITASLIYPEKELGKSFWNKVYAKAQEKYGKSVVMPVNTFNKVWIMADKAEVYEHNQTALVTKSHLKVMLEEDYLATRKQTVIANTANKDISAAVLREVIVPELEQEVNEGKNFASLRQIFNAIILASWYKNRLKDSVLNEAYSNKSTVNGIDLADKNVKQEIYDRYLEAYKKGVFNYIKDENTNGVQQPRKYFSGGIDAAMATRPQVVTTLSRDAAMSAVKKPSILQTLSTKLVGDEKKVSRELQIRLEEKAKSNIALLRAIESYQDFTVRTNSLRFLIRHNLLAVEQSDFERVISKVFLFKAAQTPESVNSQAAIDAFLNQMNESLKARISKINLANLNAKSLTPEQRALNHIQFPILRGFYRYLSGMIIKSKKEEMDDLSDASNDAWQTTDPQALDHVSFADRADAIVDAVSFELREGNPAMAVLRADREAMARVVKEALERLSQYSSSSAPVNDANQLLVEDVVEALDELSYAKDFQIDFETKQSIIEQIEQYLSRVNIQGRQVFAIDGSILPEGIGKLIIALSRMLNRVKSEAETIEYRDGNPEVDDWVTAPAPLMDDASTEVTEIFDEKAFDQFKFTAPSSSADKAMIRTVIKKLLSGNKPPLTLEGQLQNISNNPEVAVKDLQTLVTLIKEQIDDKPAATLPPRKFESILNKVGSLKKFRNIETKDVIAFLNEIKQILESKIEASKNPVFTRLLAQVESKIQEVQKNASGSTPIDSHYDIFKDGVEVVDDSDAAMTIARALSPSYLMSTEMFLKSIEGKKFRFPETFRHRSDLDEQELTVNLLKPLQANGGKVAFTAQEVKQFELYVKSVLDDTRHDMLRAFVATDPKGARVSMETILILIKLQKQPSEFTLKAAKKHYGNLSGIITQEMVFQTKLMALLKSSIEAVTYRGIAYTKIEKEIGVSAFTNADRENVYEFMKKSSLMPKYNGDYKLAKLTDAIYHAIRNDDVYSDEEIKSLMNPTLWFGSDLERKLIHVLYIVSLEKRLNTMHLRIKNLGIFQYKLETYEEVFGNDPQVSNDEGELTDKELDWFNEVFDERFVNFTRMGLSEDVNMLTTQVRIYLGYSQTLMTLLSKQVDNSKREKLLAWLEDVKYNLRTLVKYVRASKLESTDDQWKSFVNNIIDVNVTAQLSAINEVLNPSGSKKAVEAVILQDRKFSPMVPETLHESVSANDTVFLSKQAKRANQAMSVNGGIDLMKTESNTVVRKDGQGVQMHLDPAMIERIKREGINSLTPVIYNIAPLTNIWSLLGLTPPTANDRLAGA